MCDTVKYLHQIENLLFLKLLRGYLHNVFIRRNSFSRLSFSYFAINEEILKTYKEVITWLYSSEGVWQEN